MNLNKQPKELYLLFSTELWERFGFYAVQTILVLYMSQGLHFSDQQAYLLYGTFSALLYITPVIGGYLADRYIGFQNAIIFGGILLALGYAISAFPQRWLFFTGLSIVVAGNGFLKPNVSSIVGTLYQQDDPRREGGFTLFYMGINIGSLIPPLFVGSLVKYEGWGSGFGIAALGMVIGLLTFVIGRKLYKQLGGQTPVASIFVQRRKKLLAWFGLVIAVAISIVIFSQLMNMPDFTNVLLIIIGLIYLIWVFMKAQQETVSVRHKLYACVILIIISIGFWAVYNQTFTSLMLYAQRNMAKQFLGFSIDPENTQFFNPFFIFLLSPILNKLWTKLDGKGLNPSISAKFFAALLCISIGFYVLAIGDHYFNHQGVVSAAWLAASYFLQTIGEMLISPIGLAMVTLYTPQRMVGSMMGFWFFMQAAAFAISGNLATFADVVKHASVLSALHTYDHAFIIYGSITLVLFLISLFFKPLLNRLTLS